VREEHRGRGHPHRAELLHLPLEAPVLLGQRAKAALRYLLRAVKLAGKIKEEPQAWLNHTRLKDISSLKITA
jgi:hypothetical protein